MYDEVVQFIRRQFGSAELIPLHEPTFAGREKEYLLECIDSTFVSSVGPFVDRFESALAEYVGARHAVVTVNGTAALHAALRLAGVDAGDEVLTQALTFVATANAIAYCGATPCFVDVDRDTLGLSPVALREFLASRTRRDGPSGETINRETGRRLAACVPMHTFGHPCRIDEIVLVCQEFGIPVIEDAAESLGSTYQGRHTGTFGQQGIFSFNGNKTITCGGGGAIVTNDPVLAKRAKHLTTTAKRPHRWEYVHDEVGYNYRMPNLNAALGCAQLEQLDAFVQSKRELADAYQAFFPGIGISFISEPVDARSNYWLNALVLPDRGARDAFLQATNDAGIMTRPIWRLMSELDMYRDAPRDPLENARWLEDRVVNIPSSTRMQ